MKAKYLREWLMTIPDESIIEGRFVTWGALREEDIRAIWLIRYYGEPKEKKV
jgi:hypothetical protein